MDRKGMGCLMVAIICSMPIIINGDKCNENVCGSVVSKCQLMQKCNCEVGVINATCTLECFKCLDYLYMECCHCVAICPKHNETDVELSTKSHVEELPEPMPHLFTTLTEEEDDLMRWTTQSFPVQVSFMSTKGGAHDPMVTIKESDGIDEEEDVIANCTVAFMANCMPFNKCKASCTSMGSTAYRWFHDGCCECVGPHCINYGLNESKCHNCPLEETEDSAMRVDTKRKSNSTPSGKGSSLPMGSEDYEVGPSMDEDDVELKESMKAAADIEEMKEKEKHGKV